MTDKQNVEEKNSPSQSEKDTFRLPHRTVKNLTRQTVPENARATVPIKGPPIDMSDEFDPTAENEPTS